MTILYITQRLAAIEDALKPCAPGGNASPITNVRLLAFQFEVVWDTATARRHRRPCPLTR